MKSFSFAKKFAPTIAAAAIAYKAGEEKGIKHVEHPDTWQQMPPERVNAAAFALSKYEGVLSKEAARKLAARSLEDAAIAHGDTALPNSKVHSGRVVVSQWQRTAAGATIMVFGRNDEGSLSIVLGPQRGHMVQPKGYMESQLPKDDETGLRAQGASRKNGTTGELVPVDHTIEGNAIREVREETGLNISEAQLKLLGVTSHKDENPIVHTIAVNYRVMLDNTPKLGTLDHEFADDDMQHPSWVKLGDIRYDELANKHYAGTSPLPLHKETTDVLKSALQSMLEARQLSGGSRVTARNLVATLSREEEKNNGFAAGIIAARASGAAGAAR